jgi:hypothetical protein
MAERTSPVSGIDVSVPNVARMYDYLLGGKDNFAADREAAHRFPGRTDYARWTYS